MTAIRPGIHWAQIQHFSGYAGRERRLYDFELMYVYSGSMTVHFAAAERTETIVYRPGDLLFIRANERHSVEIPAGPETRVIGIHFDFYDEFRMDDGLYMVADERHPRPERFCRLPEEAAFARKYASVPAELPQWMELACEEFNSRLPGSGHACAGTLLLIVAALMRMTAEAGSGAAYQYREQLRQLTGDIGRSLHLPWLNADMAARLNVSEDHFIRLFKQAYGTTPRRYIQRLRHQEARRCLRETEMKAEAIARRIGCDSLHRFSALFKQWEGLSPREYRRRS